MLRRRRAGRAKALAREPVTMVLESGNVVLPAGTEFEVLESGPASVRLRHRIGEVSVSARAGGDNGSPGSEGGGAFSRPGPARRRQPRPLRMPQLRVPEARPGSVGEGKKPATWEVPRRFYVSFGRLHRTGHTHGRRAPWRWLFFSHPGYELGAADAAVANVEHFRAATNGEASLFTFEYPEIIVRRLVGQMLGRYLAWDETARIDATGLAARLVDADPGDHGHRGAVAGG